MLPVIIGQWTSCVTIASQRFAARARLCSPMVCVRQDKAEGLATQIKRSGEMRAGFESGYFRGS
ncbi:hypothetical protein [Chamaesiphon minutus]|uniref:hypothetical protein n=1 Tax=Chamaesiphon minutus TaxID=1173032 RepID=UPI0002FCCE6E|nr:hypothetical protein [Chamaesiphon minutus]